MKNQRTKRPPSPSARQTWDKFIRLPLYWNEIKENIILSADSTKDARTNVLLKS
jgi:hypothetical protein